jgi:DNA transformation protein and related proteins
MAQMAQDSVLLDYLLDQLAPLGQVRGRAMFGGHGLYLDGIFVGILADETLYLKVDQKTQPAFVTAGAEPFVYRSRGRQVRLSFWQAPAEVLEDPQELCRWVAGAAEAARRAVADRPRRKVRGRNPAPKRSTRDPGS